MGMQAVAEAMARFEAVLRRRPAAGLSDDAPARARWSGTLRVAVAHPKGFGFATDMPSELGGQGEAVTPGWLYRAGLASCATTSIAMLAAAEGVALTRLEVEASSRSDARGLFAMHEPDGRPVSPAPQAQALQVRLAAENAAPAELHDLVARALARSPVPQAVQAAGLAVRVETG